MPSLIREILLLKTEKLIVTILIYETNLSLLMPDDTTVGGGAGTS